MRLGSLTLPALALAVLAACGCAVPGRALATPHPVVVRPQSSVLCKAVGLLSGVAGTVCKAASHPKTIVSVGKKLITGHPGRAVKAILGDGGKAASAAVGLAAVVAWVSGGARAALNETAKLVDESSRPNLHSTWFSSAYWRVAAVSALLTLPFLFAAAIQALLRSDMTLLARAAFGYLPLGMLAVGVAAPITMLLLSASDEMSALVSTASGNAGTTFLSHATALTAVADPFVAFLVAGLTVTGAIALWLELLVREAAVYVIVLMLPLFFAALVWPARRVWAVRAVELLVALILSKFVIVAVLALGGAALAHAAALSISSLLAGLALVLMAAFSPWAVLRVLPLQEMASAAAAGLQDATRQKVSEAGVNAHNHAVGAAEFVDALPSRLHEMAAQARGRGAAETARLPAAQDDDADRPTSPAGVEDAAEEAATAVAVGSGATVGSPTAPASAPTRPGGDDHTAPGPTGPYADDHAAPMPDDDRQLTAAEGAATLPELWHRPWGPVTLGPEMDADRPVDGSPPGSPPLPAAPDPDRPVDGPPPPQATPPPAAPDPDPRPPADEDGR
jgi:hypothetical protein